MIAMVQKDLFYRARQAGRRHKWNRVRVMRQEHDATRPHGAKNDLQLPHFLHHALRFCNRHTMACGIRLLGVSTVSLPARYCPNTSVSTTTAPPKACTRSAATSEWPPAP